MGISAELSKQTMTAEEQQALHGSNAILWGKSLGDMKAQKKVGFQRIL